MPTVTADGQTYTFTLRPGFRFSNGQPVQAGDFAYAIRRDRDPRMHSPAVAFLHDVVRVTAPAANRLTIQLARPAPDFLARLAMPFFCAIPAGTPINPSGIDTIPSAGPYYVASRSLGRSITLERNPYYGGSRPQHLDEIDIRVFQDWRTSIQEIEQGAADYEVHGIPPELVPLLAREHGANGPRFFAHRGPRRPFWPSTPVARCSETPPSGRQSPTRSIGALSAIQAASTPARSPTSSCRLRCRVSKTRSSIRRSPTSRVPGA